MPAQPPNQLQASHHLCLPCCCHSKVHSRRHAPYFCKRRTTYNHARPKGLLQVELDAMRNSPATTGAARHLPWLPIIPSSHTGRASRNPDPTESHQTSHQTSLRLIWSVGKGALLLARGWRQHIPTAHPGLPALSTAHPLHHQHPKEHAPSIFSGFFGAATAAAAGPT